MFGQWHILFVTVFYVCAVQYHSLLMNQCPRALDGTSLTPAQHISRLTRNLQSCLLDHRLIGFTPSTLALAVISLNMEFLGWQLWLHATITLQSHAQVNIFLVVNAHVFFKIRVHPLAIVIASCVLNIFMSSLFFYHGFL